MINAGIVGASGYTGFELAQILNRHPAVNISFLTSESNSGARLDALYPAAPSLELIPLDSAPLDQVDVVFLCLPHGVSAAVGSDALKAGARVIDLSADFRIADKNLYAHWYHTVHPAPELLGEAVYGLTEFARAWLPQARLVANPGCYPTSILLPLQPILCAELPAGTIIADSKSGVSGAGRAPKQNTHFVEVSNNFTPYSIGRSHRHLPEMEEQLKKWNPAAPQLIFSPHLLPVPRGILSTIYIPLSSTTDEATISQLFHDAYADEPFVKLLEPGTPVSLAHVNHTNICAMSFTLAGNMLIVTSAIDNLIKGAAGQAVQNMNVMFGRPETEGLI